MPSWLTAWVVTKSCSAISIWAKLLSLIEGASGKLYEMGALMVDDGEKERLTIKFLSILKLVAEGGSVWSRSAGRKGDERLTVLLSSGERSTSSAVTQIRPRRHRARTFPRRCGPGSTGAR